MSNEFFGTGKTVQLATQLALKQVALKDFESYDIKVLQEAKKGFLGFGSKDAKVAVTLKADKEKMSEYLISEIGKFLGVQPKFDKEFKQDKNELKMIFNGDDSDKFFEILGRSSKKLEFLLTTMLNKTDRDNYVKARFNHPSLANSNRKRNPRNSRDDQDKPFRKKTENSNDGEERSERAPRNNQERPPRNNQDRPPRQNRGPRRDKNFSSGKISSVREDFIRSNAKKMAKKVLDSQEPHALAPMNSYERRLVHTALKEFDNIATKSEGDDKDRHIVIEYSA
ncbi:MAG: Jag N-terminal domain-containing protein [Candidatus Cloacimonetes bacterium]|nr:Jag N-terminal domain-containing protein [Candidatus Cloacimonadota bacterium]